MAKAMTYKKDNVQQSRIAATLTRFKQVAQSVAVEVSDTTMLSIVHLLVP
jgi:hypothetical protein